MVMVPREIKCRATETAGDRWNAVYGSNRRQARSGGRCLHEIRMRNGTHTQLMQLIIPSGKNTKENRERKGGSRQKKRRRFHYLMDVLLLLMNQRFIHSSSWTTTSSVVSSGHGVRCRGAGEEDGSVLGFATGCCCCALTYLIRSSLQFLSSERAVFPLILNSVRKDDGKSSQLNYEICKTAPLCLLCSHVSAEEEEMNSKKKRPIKNVQIFTR